LQFLYGSGEAAAMSEAIWRSLADYSIAQAAQRPVDSVVLADGATLDAPAYVPCGDKPLAAVFDIDETVVLNAGLMHQRAAGAGTRDSSILPVPGAVEAIGRLRAAGIAVIYNTNRPASMSDVTAAAIRSIGLDRPVHGQDLFLMGDDAMGADKDGRRATIAAKYCVIAMAGDQLGDISWLFEGIAPPAARRAATLAGPTARNWGHGWFVLPNSAYGNALKGDLDEIFPAAPAGGQ
jgi:predicted secreted acid phosphatase